jgi:outer membrane protein OmpA-like peptidoglycan-associated protein
MVRQDRDGATGMVIGMMYGPCRGRPLIKYGHHSGCIRWNEAGVYIEKKEEDTRQAVAASEEASVRRTKEVAAASELSNIKKFQYTLTATLRSEVLFCFDSAELKASGNAELARVGSVLKK